jgi:hypothetical protein
MFRIHQRTVLTKEIYLLQMKTLDSVIFFCRIPKLPYINSFTYEEIHSQITKGILQATFIRET